MKTILAHLGLDANRLIRVSFGPFQLGELADGKVEEVLRRVLRAQLGDRLAGEAGADFDQREDDRAPIQSIIAKGVKAASPSSEREPLPKRAPTRPSRPRRQTASATRPIPMRRNPVSRPGGSVARPEQETSVWPPWKSRSAPR